MRLVLAACVGTLILSGCSDPKKASKSNFEKAINAYLDKNPLCIDAPSTWLKPRGQEKATSVYPAYVAISSDAANSQQLDALVSAGLLSSKTGTIPGDLTWNGASGPPKPVKIYDLTDKGRKAISQPGDQATGRNQQFCYGTPKVEEITQFTEPSSAMGMTVSAVAYTYHLKDQADWATNPAVQEAIPSLKQTTSDKAEGKTEVVLTNNGWIDARGSKL